MLADGLELHRGDRSLNRPGLGRARQQKQRKMGILNMPRKTEQDTAEMLDRFQVQAHGNKYRTGLRRLKKTWLPPTRMGTLSLRSEGRQEMRTGVDWLYTSIVHDLRNPLGAIYAASKLLVEADAGPTQVKRLATNIYRAAGRMRELLADLSSVARGDRPTAEICDIGEVIAAASDAASAALNKHNIQILLKVSNGIELPLIRSHMSVFFNLVTNALEAMPAGGGASRCMPENQ
jgi:signal transduction histidine kinase